MSDNFEVKERDELIVRLRERIAELEDEIYTIEDEAYSKGFAEGYSEKEQED